MFTFRDHVASVNGSVAHVAFTDRLGGVSPSDLGSLNLGRTDLDDQANLETNLARVREFAGWGDMPIVALNQVHGDRVLTVTEEFRDAWPADGWLGDRVAGQPPLVAADAMVTSLPDVALAIRVADCVPVVFVAADVGVLGAAHAGRVGLLAGVLSRTVATMRALGADNIRAWVGPHICGECYEVPTELADEIAAMRPEMMSRTSWHTPAVDLGAGVAVELEGLGVTVSRHDPCTFTDERLFSHRRQQGKAGRQIGVVWRDSTPVG